MTAASAAPNGRTRILLLMALSLVLAMSPWFSASAVLGPPVCAQE